MNELRVDVEWVSRAVGGTLRSGDPGHVVGRVVTDSRGLRREDLFVALRGPRFDGHDFVSEVLARGAAAVIVDRRGWEERDTTGDRARSSDEIAAPAVGAVIEVGDTLKALQDLAHAIRIAAATRVVAITGSAGKTTTKEAIAEFLATRFRVVKNKGNLNNHIGLPLSLMELRTRPDVAVMELGMNHRGEISTLVAIAQPDIRVWTNVGDAHLGFFESPEAIADAKAEILERSNTDTVLVCNADDPRVMRRVRAFVGRTVTFGTAVTPASADTMSKTLASTGCVPVCRHPPGKGWCARRCSAAEIYPTCWRPLRSRWSSGSRWTTSPLPPEP